MKLERYRGNPILEKNPEQAWEAGSVLNPSVLVDEGLFRMVYRATNDIKPMEAGNYVSSIGYAESEDGIHFRRFEKPLIEPDQSYEMGLGCEDPRVVKIGEDYLLYYTAVWGTGEQMKVRVALATSRDFKTWEKQGVVGPATRSKAAILFPEKVGGKYLMLYTFMPDSPMSSIMQVEFDRFEEVINPPPGYMAENLSAYEDNLVLGPPLKVYRGPEVGAVPIKTKEGWLLIYCPANVSDRPEWSIGAALLDLAQPRRVLAKTETPLLQPETKAELAGVVGNVVFPEGAVIVGDKLYVYYGSGDQGCNLATCQVNDLLDYLVERIG
jgi:beta-1,2-mannobiose phosphorylase / 1,2-beta-oligomannan phosphorylase